MVAGEVWVEHHIEQADVFRAGRGHHGNAGQRLGQPSLWRMRILPGNLSVRRIFPPGRNARLHGTSDLSMSVVTLKGAVAWYGARVC